MHPVKRPVLIHPYPSLGFPGAQRVNNLPTKQEMQETWVFDPWFGEIPCRRVWQPTPAFLPGESHGQRATVWWAGLVGYSPWGCRELDTTEWLTLADLPPFSYPGHVGILNSGQRSESV